MSTHLILGRWIGSAVRWRSANCKQITCQIADYSNNFCHNKVNSFMNLRRFFKLLSALPFIQLYKQKIGHNINQQPYCEKAHCYLVEETKEMAKVNQPNLINIYTLGCSSQLGTVVDFRMDNILNGTKFQVIFQLIHAVAIHIDYCNSQFKPYMQ